MIRWLILRHVLSEPFQDRIRMLLEEYITLKPKMSPYDPVQLLLGDGNSIEYILGVRRRRDWVVLDLIHERR